MKRVSLALFLAVVTLSQGCSLVERQGRFGPTLADLPPPVLPQDIEPLQPATLDQIEESYRSALSVAKTPQLRHRILVRLADIEMVRSENRQLTAEEEQQYFDDAIAMYDELLVVADTNGAEEIDDERLLYRLSKAYALDGRMTESDAALARLVELYPNSPFAAEADFRRAEQAFNRGDYAQAEQLYQKVLYVGDSTPFYLNAVYMLGWSQFKANKFRRSIATFTEVMDRLLPDQEALAALNNSKNAILEDTLRVLGITFTYLDGAPSVTEVYQNIGPRHYQHLIYQRLGDLYLDKSLYKDAADTYTHYIQQFPESIYGPEFASYRMAVYTQGGFPDEILPAKEQFVEQYGVHSAYWAQHGESQQAKLTPYLETYLDELSSFYHAEGLALQKQWRAYEKQRAAGKRAKRPEGQPEEKFLRASGYYSEFLVTFPASPRKAEMTFLMAEALYEAGALDQAITAYEQVAYELLDETRGAGAGYAAILALQTQIEQSQDPVILGALEQHKIRSAINFADYYPADPRAVAVLTQAAQEVFGQGQSEQAVAIAARITQWQPPPEPALLKTAWLILAHSAFDAADFTQAESAYRQVLTLLPPDDSERAGVIERIAACMFKSAEQQVAAGQTAQAVEQLLMIQNAAPDSELAISGQYDAGNYLMELKDWRRAEQVFLDLQSRYPTHQLTGTLLPKLVVIYQELEQWDKAAAVLAKMSSSEADPETRRQSLYLSAELYQKSGRLKDSAARYAEYVKRYPQPFDLAIEARYQLLQLALERKDRTERNYWLSQLIKADDSAGSQRTDRSRYLAAYASNQFANDAFVQFERIKLTLPIKKSLKAKKKALDETLRAYKKVLDYGVAEFVTEANYRIGNVYSQLSRDLMNSERPNGLDELALEQYEILLEEQAYPFEEKSVELLQANAERSWDGFYDEWVEQSFKELAKILPARYGKKEKSKGVSHGLR